MAWTIEFDPRTEKELRNLDPQAARRILNFLRDRAAPLDDPRMLATPLKGKWADYWRFRVGAYRLLCGLQDETLTVLVLRVGHRRSVYQE